MIVDRLQLDEISLFVHAKIGKTCTFHVITEPKKCDLTNDDIADAGDVRRPVREEARSANVAVDGQRPRVRLRQRRRRHVLPAARQHVPRRQLRISDILVGRISSNVPEKLLHICI